MGAAPGLGRLLARRGRPGTAWCPVPWTIDSTAAHHFCSISCSVPLAARVVQCGIAAMSRVIRS